MKLVTIDGREVAGRPGVVLSNGDYLDLSAAPSALSESQWIPHSVVSILAAGDSGLATTRAIIGKAESLSDLERKSLYASEALCPVGDTQLMAPLRRPGLMLVNLAALPDGGGDHPDLDSVYIKSPNTATNDAAEVRLPAFAGGVVTVTPMLAAILGKPLQEADVSDAAAAIAAYTVILELDYEGFALDPEGSAIDWRRFVESKQVPDSCPMGPAMITVDEIPEVADLRAAVSINGVSSVEAPVLPNQRVPAEVVAHLSQRYGFSAGDLIAFGSQFSSALKVELQAGDRIQVALKDVSGTHYMTLTSGIAV